MCYSLFFIQYIQHVKKSFSFFTVRLGSSDRLYEFQCIMFKYKGLTEDVHMNVIGMVEIPGRRWAGHLRNFAQPAGDKDYLHSPRG